MMNNGMMQGMGMGRGGMMGPGQPQRNGTVNSMGGMSGGMGGRMGGPMGGPPGFNPQMQPQQQHQQAHMQKHILTQLHKQSNRQGWQPMYNISMRVQNVHQLLTQLRLLHPDAESVEQMMNVAIAFEGQTFNDSPDSATYEAKIRAKQVDIHTQRSKQAQGLEQHIQNSRPINMSMVQQRGMPNGMQNGIPNQLFNQVGSGYPNPQMQQQMQRPAMPMQQQPQQQQPGQGMIGFQINRNPNQMQMEPGGQPGLPQQIGPQSLNPQEMAIVTRLGNQLYQQASPQDREQARQRVLSGPPQTVQMLQQRQIPPVQWWYRQLAMKQFMIKKQQESQNQQRQGNVGGALGNGIPGQPTSAQNIVNGPPQSQIGAGQQGLGANFGGNMQQIMGLQESALREQEAGRVVVPASQQQRMNRQPAFNQQVGQIGLQAPQQEMLKQQSIMQSARANLGQGQARPPSNMTGQPQRQPPLQGQAGGLGSSTGQGLPQQSPAMPNLNRPMDPNMSRPPTQAQPKQPPPQSDPAQTPGQATQRSLQIGKAQQQQQPTNQQHKSQQQQAQSGKGSNYAQENSQNLPAWAMHLPKDVLQALKNMPEDRRNQFIAEKEKKASRNQNQPVQNNQGQQTQHPSSSEKPSNTGSSAPTTGAIGNLLPNLNASAMSLPRLTKEQIEGMDKAFYPRNMLNAAAMAQHIPDDVRTWGQLKEWCKNNKHIVPEESLRKLDSFQALHRTSIVKHQIANNQMLRQGVSSQQPHGQPMPTSTTSQPPAPMAPMAQTRQNQTSNQPPLNLRGQPSQPATEKDFQTLRSRLPPHMQNLSDEQLKMVIMKMRMQRLSNQTGSNGQPRQISNASTHENKTQPGPPSQGSNQPHSQGPMIAGQQGKLPGQGPTQKGIKRANDDARDGQDSKATPQQAPAPTPNQALIQMQKELSNHAPTSVSQQSSTQTSVQPHAQQLGSGPMPPIDQSKLLRFKQIYTEVRSTYRSRPTFPIDEKQREDWAKLLEANKEFLVRHQMGALHYYSSVNSNENSLREILRDCIALLELFQGGRSAPTSQTTMSHREAFESFNKLRNLFYQVTLKRKGKEKDAPQATEQSLNTEPSTAPLQTQPKQLEHAAQPMIKQQSKQKHGRDKEPPAPTTDKPPFAFGTSPPPHGVPTYGQNIPGLTQDQLSIPSKRRKLDSQQAKSQASPAAPPEKRTAPVPPKPEPAFKCQLPSCEHAKKGFMTGEALAQHMDEAHKEKEPENPLAYALEQARAGLGLDANGKPLIKERPAKMEKSLSAQPMKLSASAQGPTPRLEGGTPMSRGTTHLSNLGAPRTPQPAGKPIESKATPQSSQGQAEPPMSSSEPATPDSWSDLGITPQDLAANFPEMGDIPGPLRLSSLTPASTLTTKSEKNTPKSDIGEDTAIKINIDADSWLPPGFLVDCYDRDTDTSFMNDDLLGMDWETIFPDSGGKLKGKKRGQSDGFRADLFGIHLGP